jgi:hypothetical protein
MEIPAVFAAFRNGGVQAGPADFANGRFSFPFGTRSITEVVPQTDERTPVVVTDAVGLNERGLDDRLLMSLKIPGNDIWYMTHIRDANDVLDSFMGNADKVLIPYHTVRDRSVLKDAFEMSDNCIPVIFTASGPARNKTSDADIMLALDNVSSIGFESTILFDNGGYITKEKWAVVSKEHSNTIPFEIVRDPNRPYADAGRIISGILL